MPYTPDYLRRPGHRHRPPHPRHRAAPRSKSSRSIATTPCGPASAARMARKASCSIRRAARCRSSWRTPARGHAARALQQEQRRGRDRDLPRASRDAAAPRGFRGAAHQLGEQGRQPRRARRASWNSASTPSSWWTTIPRSAPRRRPALPKCWRCRCPPTPREIPGFPRHVWAFDRARVTEEDRRRAELYAQRAERVRAERAAANLEEFLASLNWRSRSRRWSRRRWRASRSSPSAPTR